MTEGKPEYNDNPRGEVRWGLAIAGAFFIGLLGWSAFARVDAAVYATGEIEVVGNRQSVQHPEGGVVSALYVKEGDQVETGDVLLELGSPQVQADARASASQTIGLLALRARLVAERDGTSIRRPNEFDALTDSEAAEAAAAMARQSDQLTARRNAIANERAVYGQQRNQLNEQIDGYEQQVRANLEQQRLINDELEGMRELNSRGFASINRVRALERQAASLEGSEGEYQALIARAREAIGQIELQTVGLERRQTEEVVEQLRQVEAELGNALPRWDAARERLQSTQVRAPATGEVVGLSVFTVGGVVSAGQVLMDIVPESAALTVVSQVAPADADDLQVGQKTEVRFSGLRGLDFPNLEGEVVEFSADSFVDERSGVRYFRAEIEVPPEEWQRLHAQNDTAQLRPGLPVEVIIPTRKRTVLQFIFEPLQQHLWRSFRET